MCLKRLVKNIYGIAGSQIIKTQNDHTYKYRQMCFGIVRQGNTI